jgi:hypothetical protein
LEISGDKRTYVSEILWYIDVSILLKEPNYLCRERGVRRANVNEQIASSARCVIYL